jgi:hypothetical protein
MTEEMVAKRGGQWFSVLRGPLSRGDRGWPEKRPAGGPGEGIPDLLRVGPTDPVGVGTRGGRAIEPAAAPATWTRGCPTP